MSTRIRTTSEKEYYHVYNRTVLKIPEFGDSKNADRLKLTFLAANSTISNKAFDYIRNTNHPNVDHIMDILVGGDKLTDVLSYVIMPTHYHILLNEKRDGSIRDFIHKTNTSIAKYINTKKERKGPLFEGRYKIEHVDSNEYLLHLWRYIHLNPLDFILGRSWRKGKLKNWKLVLSKLEKYQWSSLDYFLKNKKDPIISGAEIIKDQFKDLNSYTKFLREWTDDGFNNLSNF